MFGLVVNYHYGASRAGYTNHTHVAFDTWCLFWLGPVLFLKCWDWDKRHLILYNLYVVNFLIAGREANKRAA